MVLKQIEERAVNIQTANNKTLYEFNGKIFISTERFSGFFNAVVLDGDKLVFFDGVSPFARILDKKYWNSIKFE